MRSDRGLRLGAPAQVRRAVLSLACGALALSLASCAGLSGGANRQVHVVAKGETVWSIARRYGTTVEAVARANRLSDPSRIRIGDRLWVPGRRPARAFGAQRGSPPVSIGPGRGGPSAPLGWPVRGEVTSRFGLRRGAHHDGIDIRAARGTPVRAALDGVVVHSGNRLSGYGNLIILKHTDDRATVYAHNRVNLVRVGEPVRAGQVIAEVGATGRTSGPHLHFEVRQDGRALDPLEWLP